jgi:hypothetical protein
MSRRYADQSMQILKDFEKHDIRVYPSHHAEDRENVPEIEVGFRGTIWTLGLSNICKLHL